MSDLLNQASLVMVPSGYKEDTVYSVVPSDGSGDLSFTRASNGTRVNSAGLVEVVAWNLYSYSEDFTDGSWTRENCTISANATTAPNGTTTADKLILNNGVSAFGATSSGLRNTLSIAENIYTYSVYCKASEITSAVIRENDSVGSFMIVSLSDGAITYSGGSSQFINPSAENIGNGWFRIIWTSPNTITSANKYSLRQNVNGNGTSGFFVWGYQLNIGSTAKPYFPTTDRLNVPRLTYQNGGGGCPSLLLEKQSTNLCLWSEDLSNATSWIKFNATVTANDAISPDGTQNADKVVFSGTNHYFYQQSSFVGQATASIYVKGTAGQTISIDNTQTITEPLITLTGEWQRVVLTSTTSGAAVQGLAISTFQSATARTIYVWGGQIEASSYATSLINTTSSSATRVADACITASVPSLIGQTEGVLFLDFNRVNTFEPSAIILSKVAGTTINAYYDSVYFYQIANGGLVVEGYNNNVQQFGFSAGALSIGRHKIAVAYKANDFVLYIDGAQIGTDTSGSVPTMNFLTIGGAADVPNNGQSINQTILFPTRLTNAELASLTTI